MDSHTVNSIVGLSLGLILFIFVVLFQREQNRKD
jgi:hypothetical protein